MIQSSLPHTLFWVVNDLFVSNGDNYFVCFVALYKFFVWVVVAQQQLSPQATFSTLPGCLSLSRRAMVDCGRETI